MSQALYSGGDVFQNVGGIAASIAATTYAGTNQSGSTGPAAGTKMSFVGKYIDVIGATEFNQLRAAGLSVFFFLENTSLQHNSGAATYSAGVAAANSAIAGFATLGIPRMPVYFAIDYDATTNDAILWSRYFEGVSDTLGAGNTGMYGSGAVNFEINRQMNTDGYSGLSWFCQARSYGWRGNSGYNGQHIWQWPPGYNPSGNLVISGIGIDGDFAYYQDFGQYPRPSAPVPGGGGTGVVTTTAPVFGQQSGANTSNINAIFTQPVVSNIVTPRDTHDEVMLSNTYTASISNAVGSYTIGPVDSIGIPGFPIGNFSFDNGGTWNDFGFIFSGDFGSFPGTLPPVVLQAEVTPTGKLSFNAAANQVVGTANKISLIIHCAILYAPAVGGPSVIKTSKITQRLGYGTKAIRFSDINQTYVNATGFTPKTEYSAYRRLSTDSFITTGSETIAHKLNGVPNLMFWGYDGSSILTQPVVWSSGGAVSTHLGIAMDSTNIYFNVDSGLQKVFYRTYLDN